jgi:tripartite-type tricarboxylate transporter receptor subunit TctC
VAYEVSQLAAVARVLANPTLLAVPASASNRIASFPDVPTFKKLGYGDVEFYIWAGLFAQQALPAPIMTRLREAMAEAVKAPEVTKTFETAGSPVAYMDAPEFSKFVAEDSARLIAAVKKIGKVE